MWVLELIKLFSTLFSQGIKQEREESGYERTSDTYEDLEALLKNTSPYFAENTNKQVYSGTWADAIIVNALRLAFFAALSFSFHSRNAWVLKCLFVP